MSPVRPCHSQAASFRSDYRSTFHRKHSRKAAPAGPTAPTCNNVYFHGNDYPLRNYNDFHDFATKFADDSYNPGYVNPQIMPPLKKRKFSASACDNGWRSYQQSNSYKYVPSACKSSSVLASTTRPDTNASKSTTCKRDRASFGDGAAIFMSRDEIERCSPSRNDGIDALHETHLRYSYCAFLQDLGFRLDLPQTTIGTAMVLCHRFFVRRSHAFHDRFLVATAALFLAAKSEETPRPLNNVLRASSEVFHKQDFSFLSHMLPADWFEQYREQVIEAEQLILTTLDFELNVQHPYAPLTSMLDKLGLSQSVLVNLSLKLVSEGVYTRLACTLFEILSWRIGVLFMESFNQQICYGCLNYKMQSIKAHWPLRIPPELPLLLFVYRELSMIPTHLPFNMVAPLLSVHIWHWL